ncbi:MAG: hypothetical protein ACKO3G_17660, partial [Planctomycetaceae bacterium]
HADLAARALEGGGKKQLGDAVSKRLLEALTPPPEAKAEAAADGGTAPGAETGNTAAPAGEAAAAAEGDAAEPEVPAGPETDLVGVWKAVDGKNVLTLTITEDSSFTWKAEPEGKPAVELSGRLDSNRDSIALETESQGTMMAKVTSRGADAFDFIVAGAPKEAKPLEFKRQK